MTAVLVRLRRSDRPRQPQELAERLERPSG